MLAFAFDRSFVVFVESDVDDVVPTACVMALESLVHGRVLLRGMRLLCIREAAHRSQQQQHTRAEDADLRNAAEKFQTTWVIP